MTERELQLILSKTILCNTEAQAVYSSVKATKIEFRLQTLGAADPKATYVAIGNAESQEFKLTAVDNYYATPEIIAGCQYIDPSKIFVRADVVGKAVVEVTIWR